MLNNEFNSIRESLVTLTRLNHDLILMDIANILIRRNYRRLEIPKLITGGCSGVDLNYSSCIGKGMLTASILGDIEVAPTSSEILGTIRALSLDNSNGILMIIRNCESFNFNLAHQRAIADNLPVKTIIIDDCWNGLLVVSKILGAMAEQGDKLDEIYNFYHSILVGRITNIKIDDSCQRNQVKRLKLHENLDNMDDLNLVPNTTIVALFSSRQLSKLDELRLIDRIINKLRKLQVFIARFYVGNPVNTQETCLTIIKDVTTKILEYLDCPTSAECWRQVKQSSPSIDPVDEPSGLHVPVTAQGPKLSDTSTKNLETTLLFACEALISCETQLNTIDLENSKGNIGTRFRTVAELLKMKLADKTIITNYPCSLLKSLSILLENTIRGKMGSIYGVLLDSAAEQFKHMPTNLKITPFEWLQAIEAALEAFTRICDEDQRLTTMYFPLRTFYKIANDEYCCKTENFIHSFNLATYGAEKAADKTRLSNQQYGNSGAHAVGIWLRAVYEGVKLTCYCGGFN